MFCNKCGKEIADDSAFCNFCGNKFSPVVENAAEKSANSIDSMLMSGKEAKSRKDWRGMQRFYGAILLENPNHFGAAFYDAYAKAMETMSVEEVFRRKAEMNVLNTVMLDMPNSYDPENPESVQTVAEYLDDLKNIIGCSFVYKETRNGYGIVVETNKDETYAIFVQTIKAFQQIIGEIYARDDSSLEIHKSAMNFYSVAKSLSWDYASKMAIGNEVNRCFEEECSKVEQLRKMRIDAYWSEHAEEKQQLETEKNESVSEVEELQKQIEAMAEFDEHKRIQAELDEVNTQIAGTGASGVVKEMNFKEKGFKAILGLKSAVSNKMNEKKELKEKRSEIEQRLAAAKARLDEASQTQTERISILQSRINEIDEELNKER